MKTFSFSHAVLRWFDQHGRHDLPWQKNQTPYRVWISEIMLQQTQVGTVIPYYEKFMSRFPTIKELAIAELDEVLGYWSGLGYYARARNLYKSAKIVYQEMKGEFPNSVEKLAELPGVGLSTAGAILSLGMKKPATILDGNVKRLLSRYHAIDEPLNNNTIKKLWQLADDLTPKDRCNDYNQAVMDLGAMICTRTQPKCNICPIQKNCAGYQSGQPAFYPIKTNKKSIPTRSVYMLILQKKSGEILLEKRPPTGIWGSLWSLPECPLTEDVLNWSKKHFSFQTEILEKWPVLYHQFTHFNLEINPLLLKIKKITPTAMDNPNQIWYKEGQLPGGLPAPVLKLLKSLTQ